MRTFLKLEAAPDVLDTIANLSNDEVFTTPGVANQMLDLLPKEVWSNPDLKFLDPCCKTGVFLREITKRLMIGLAKIIPDMDARRDHILRNQVYGIAITELTALMSRRTLYCASDATRLPNPDFPENCFSAVVFDTPEGNIKFPEVEHDYDHKNKCSACGTSDGVLTGEDREGCESYAYPFIHRNIQEIFGVMQFDVVIGNPPYQLNIGNLFGNKSKARAIYHKFIDVAKSLDPKFLCFIVPSRWMFQKAEGISDDWVKGFASDHRLSKVFHFPNEGDCFKGVSIKGGVNYFLLDRLNTSGMTLSFVNNGSVQTVFEGKLSDAVGFISGDPISNDIIKKVSLIEERFSSIVSPKDFFTNKVFLTSSWSGFLKSIEGIDDPVKVYVNKANHGLEFGWVPRSEFPKNRDFISGHKVFIPAASGNGPQVLGKPFYGGEDTACSQTYLAIGYDGRFSPSECENVISYIKSKFFRYLVSIKKTTQNGARAVYDLVPMVDFSQSWCDAKLYSLFNLNEEEIALIESSIREML